MEQRNSFEPARVFGARKNSHLNRDKPIHSKKRSIGKRKLKEKLIDARKKKY